MARLPTYTAQQGIQPAGAPSIPDQGQVGRAIQGAGNALQGLGSQLSDLQQHAAKLQEQKSALKTDNATDLFAAQQKTLYQEFLQNSAPEDGSGIHEAWITGFDENAKTYLNSVPADQKEKVAGQIALLRQGYETQSAKDEATLGGNYSLNSAKNWYESTQNEVRNNPAGREVAEKTLFGRINNLPYMTDQQKALLIDSYKNGIEIAQVKGLAPDDPDKVEEMAGRGGGAVALPKGTIGPAQTDRESAAMSYFMGRGYSREQAAGIVGNLVHESGGLNVKSRNPGDGSDGTDSIGIAQWNSTRAKNLKDFAAAQGKDWHDLGVQLAFVDHELNTGYTSVKQKLLAAKTPDEAAGVFVTGYERPQGSEGGAAASHGWSNRRDQSRRLAGGNYKPGETEPGSSTPDSRFSSITMDQWDQLYEGALRQQKANQTTAATAATLAQTQLVDTLQTGIINNQIGQADIKPYLDRQQIKPDQYLQLQGQIEKRDKDQTDTRSFFDALNGGRDLNPFSSDDKRIAEAGFKALGSNVEAADTVYRQTGIVPSGAATQMRGAIFGANAQNASQALQIASNIMTANPSAFKGVDGGDDIAKASVAYQHYVGIGMSTDGAVHKVMEQNDPTYKSKIRVTDTDLKTFQDSITSGKVAGLFDAHPWIPFVGNAQVGADPQQQSDILADFKQTATEFYQESGDKNLALAQAKDQLSKVYGVTNAFGTATVTKYPPEKAYPALPNDTNGGFGYIQRQAVAAVKEATGRDVDPSSITLMPIPGSTQRAFTSGQPVPYRVAYHWANSQGQQQRDVIYGKAFVADPSAALAELRAAGQQELQQSDAWKRDQLQKDEAARQQLGDLYGGILTTNTRPSEVEIQDNARAAANTAKAKGLQPLPPAPSQSDIPKSGNDAFRKAVEQFGTSQSEINMSGGS